MLWEPVVRVQLYLTIVSETSNFIFQSFTALSINIFDTKCLWNDQHTLPLRMEDLSLRADVSYFLCFTRWGGICVTASLIVFQYPAVFQEFVLFWVLNFV